MEYSKEKMEKLQKADRFINFVIKDLSKRNNGEDVLEVVFNSEVLTGGIEMQNKYNRL